MKITVFDADQACRDVFSAVVQGHDVTYVESAITDQAVSEHVDTEILSVFVSSKVTKAHIDALPSLKLIVARSTGVDHIDVAYAKEKGVAVANVPRYGTHTVAEYAFALMLTLSRRVVDAYRQVHEHNDFTTNKLEGFDLFGKTLGVVGTGAIGRTAVGIAQGFGMRVFMHDKFPNNSLENETTKYVPLEELLRESDIVTLHAPYTPETHHLLNEEKIALMKRGALLINTARGELVDTNALLEALKSGAIGGAGLDVIENERSLRAAAASPEEQSAIDRDHTIIDMPNVILTPHIAFFSREAYREILTVSANDVVQFAAGTPQNLL